MKKRLVAALLCGVLAFSQGAMALASEPGSMEDLLGLSVMEEDGSDASIVLHEADEAELLNEGEAGLEDADSITISLDDTDDASDDAAEAGENELQETDNETPESKPETTVEDILSIEEEASIGGDSIPEGEGSALEGTADPDALKSVEELAGDATVLKNPGKDKDAAPEISPNGEYTYTPSYTDGKLDDQFWNHWYKIVLPESGRLDITVENNGEKSFDARVQNYSNSNSYYWSEGVALRSSGIMHLFSGTYYISVRTHPNDVRSYTIKLNYVSSGESFKEVIPGIYLLHGVNGDTLYSETLEANSSGSYSGNVEHYLNKGKYFIEFDCKNNTK